VVAGRLKDCSRSQAAASIRQGRIKVDGSDRKPGYRVRPGESVTGTLPPPPPSLSEPEPLDLAILWEDEHLLIIDKQPGLVVHPAAGHRKGTLVNALLFHRPELGALEDSTRPGIVHRLDKDTSGTLVVAKNPIAGRGLLERFRNRTVEKTYLALVRGTPRGEGGWIRLPIGRHPVDRKRMSTTSRKPRTAETRWRLRRVYHGASLLEVDLKTGRTHQIRVHCAAMGHPVVGDGLYGGRMALQPLAGLRARRQMLHAWKIAFQHPVKKEMVSVSSPLPGDMSELLRALAFGSPRPGSSGGAASRKESR
jgi:23S rRNA pseudouridine1911/1915/1917 synthase